MGKEHSAALAKGAAAAVSWGASFVAIKVALRTLPPLPLVWLRFGMGVGVLAIFTVLRKEKDPLTPKEWALVLLLGFLGVPFHHLIQSTGLKTAQAATSAWIISSMPVFIALLGFLFLGEKMDRRRWFGLGLAALGVLLVVTRGDPERLLLSDPGSTGDLLVLLSALNWAAFSVVSRGFLKRHRAAPMMFKVMTAGWGMTTVLFLAGGNWDPIFRLDPSGWAAVSFLGVFCSGLAYVFWYDALKTLPASQAGVLMYLNPAAATAVAVLGLGEPMTASVASGAVLIALGVWQVNR
jgi:drug/metabolite transporter (DMT)-like permease